MKNLLSILAISVHSLTTFGVTIEPGVHTGDFIQYEFNEETNDDGRIYFIDDSISGLVVENGYNIDKLIHCFKMGSMTKDCIYSKFDNGSCQLATIPINANFPSRIEIDMEYSTTATRFGSDLGYLNKDQIAEVRVLDGKQLLVNKPILFGSLNSVYETNLYGENAFTRDSIDDKSEYKQSKSILNRKFCGEEIKELTIQVCGVNAIVFAVTNIDMKIFYD